MDNKDRGDHEAILRRRNWSKKFQDEEAGATNDTHDSTLQPLGLQSEEFNARVHQALAEISVPANLRDEILAQRKIIAIPWWREPQKLWAVAALAAVLASGLFLWRRPRGEDLTFAGFQSRMVGFALREYSMEIHTNQLGEVKQFLASKGAPADFGLPQGLAQTPVKGGAKLSWQGKPVGMVCFDWLGKQTLYMFVIDAPFATGNAAASVAEIGSFKNVATATWSASGKTFLLAGHLTAAELESLVKS